MANNLVVVIKQPNIFLLRKKSEKIEKILYRYNKEVFLYGAIRIKQSIAFLYG